MPLQIQTNVASLSAQRNLATSQANLATVFNRLSSGYRINSAKDDAAGLAISESMRLQIRSYVVAERNANDAISMSQTAEGALGQISDILGRMRELSVQGANGSLQSTDRSYLQTEFRSLQLEIQRIMTSTKFNGVSLINAESSLVNFQVGISNISSDRIAVTFGAVNLAQIITSDSRLDGVAQNSMDVMTVIDSSLARVSTARARFGAVMNRLEITTANIQTVRLNIAAANSRIRDVDVAEESAKLAREQVLAQAGTSVLAQANQVPQQALSLLKGG
jgi:flagellin